MLVRFGFKKKFNRYIFLQFITQKNTKNIISKQEFTVVLFSKHPNILFSRFGVI